MPWRWLVAFGALLVGTHAVAEGPVASSACSTLCAGAGDAAEYAGAAEKQRWAACFSCRCKESLGWMPAPEELRCSTATHLDRYRARTLPGAVVTGLEVIDPDGGDTSGCLNGGIGAAGCDLKSRFKRLVNGKTEYQMLCRKRYAGDQGFYEYLVIGANAENGATCFWQARSATFDGEAVPSLDVNDASLQPVAAAVERYARTFYLYSAGPSECTACHAADAFIWSPYLHSAYPVPVGDAAVMERLRAPYYQVSAASERLQEVGHRYLEAGPAAAGAAATPLGCKGCHRVADGYFCSSMSWDALGHSGRAGTASYDQASAYEHARRLLFWMPPGGSTHASYMARSEADRARIRACCVEGNAASCQWR